MGQYDVLFTPMQIGTLKVENRFVLEPMEGTNVIDWMTTCKFKDDVHDYYIERAKGGIGLMIPGMVLLQSMIGGKWLYKHPEVFKKVPALMDEIHSYGSKMFFQIGAGWGRAFTMPSVMKKISDNKALRTLCKPVVNMDELLVAPSELPNRWIPEVMHRPITEEEIHEFVDAYAKTALLCKNAGVDGVEVHAVHEGYLLDQFTTPYTNQRTDQYGGSFENRYRFAVEVVQAIKRLCGDDYPVSLRYSVTSKTIGFGRGAVPGEEFTEAGRDLEEGIKAAKYLQDAGYDMLNADNGTYDAWYWSHPPVYMPLNCNLSEAEKISEVVTIPVVCAGRMQPEEASSAIEAGKLTGIGIGRQFLTDPEYIVKLKENREADVLPCISCHNACLPVYHYDGVGAEMEMDAMKTQGHCAVNPRTFNEKKYTITPAKKPKHIAVIGGGIGGLTVAIVASKRGHHVDLYEKSGELGGVFIAAASPSFKEKDKDLIAWYRNEIKKQPVNIHLNTAVSSLSDIHADEIVIATGAVPRVLKMPGAEHCVEAIEFLRGYRTVGDSVAVIGGGLTGCEIAYELALEGKKPVILEMKPDILLAKGLCMANSSCMRDLLRFHKVPIYTNVNIKEITENAVLFSDPDGDHECPADSVITSCGYIAGTSLIDEKTLKHRKDVHLLGDVSKVANLKKAIWDAYDLAFAL